ncbi:hypothetical protein ACQJBY_004863 [Aegilops geniculata]
MCYANQFSRTAQFTSLSIIEYHRPYVHQLGEDRPSIDINQCYEDEFLRRPRRWKEVFVAGGGRADHQGGQGDHPEGQARRRHCRGAGRLRRDRGLEAQPCPHLRGHRRRDPPRWIGG